MAGKVVDLSGKKFGMLSVIRFAGFRVTEKTKKTLWECQCDCGNTKILPTNNFLSRRYVVSCGCRQGVAGGMSRVKNLLGKRFGKLLVISRGENIIRRGKTDVVWTCKCDCGAYKNVTSTSLIGGYTKSCGCLEMTRSYIAHEVKKYFIMNYDAIPEYRVIKSPKKFWLRADLYLPNENIFIEINGSQHYEFHPFFHRTKENFEYRVCS